MTKTQYTGTVPITVSHLEFKWTSFAKINNLDELISIPAEDSFRTQDLINRHNLESASKITADPRSTVFSKSANPLDLPQNYTICVIFKAKSVDPKPYSPHSITLHYLKFPFKISSPYTKINSCIYAHNFIMLLPCQPRIFVPLARWQ